MSFYQQPFQKFNKERQPMQEMDSASRFEHKKFGAPKRGYGSSSSYNNATTGVYNAYGPAGEGHRGPPTRYYSAKSPPQEGKKWVPFEAKDNKISHEPYASGNVSDEERPEWFDESQFTGKTEQFDFAKTVQRTKKNASELKETQPPLRPQNSGALWQFNADDIDEQLEKMCKEKNNAPFDDAIQLSDDDVSLTISKKTDLNDSDDHFHNLQAQLQTIDSNGLTPINDSQPVAGANAATALERELNAHINSCVEKAYESKTRYTINRDSLNGFFRSKIDTYIAIFPKIFSSYMHENVFDAVWLYKDNLKNVLGPFMSYDMDLWLAEGDYFSDNLMISYHGNGFFPIGDYLQRKSHIKSFFKPFESKEPVTRCAEPEGGNPIKASEEKMNRKPNEKDVQQNHEKKKLYKKVPVERAAASHEKEVPENIARIKDPPKHHGDLKGAIDPAESIMKMLGLV